MTTTMITSFDRSRDFSQRANNLILAAVTRTRGDDPVSPQRTRCDCSSGERANLGIGRQLKFNRLQHGPDLGRCSMRQLRTSGPSCWDRCDAGHQFPAAIRP